MNKDMDTKSGQPENESLENLSAVLKETGLKADVLRAWERRYNLPCPQRSSGGHRLYSRRDIDTIKWLVARQNEGLSISRAVARWNDLSRAQHDPLQAHPLGGQGATQAAGSQLVTLRQAWLDACLHFDEAAAESVLGQAFAEFPLETVCVEVIQKNMSAVGALWHSGQASVQQEHFVSALALRKLQALISATPAPWREETILAGCPPGERHTFPVLLASLLLRRRGFRVVYLGADIPLEQAAETAASVRPALVILAAQQLPGAASLRRAADALAQAGWRTAFGGLIFNRLPALAGRIRGAWLGESLDGIASSVERLVSTPFTPAEPLPLDERITRSAALIRENRPALEMTMTAELRKQGLDMGTLSEPNVFFLSGLLAALDLGDPAYMEDDIAWVEHLLPARRYPAEWLGPYLAAWGSAMEKQLGAGAEPVTGWIHSCLHRHPAHPMQ